MLGYLEEDFFTFMILIFWLTVVPSALCLLIKIASL